MSDGVGREKGTRALSPPRQRRGTSSPPRSPDAIDTIGGGKAVLVSNPDEVRAVFVHVARLQRAQDALLELLTQEDLKERRLAWEMVSKLGVDARKDGGGGQAAAQIVVHNHLPIPTTPAGS